MKEDEAEKLRRMIRRILEPWFRRVDGIELQLQGDAGIVITRDGKEIGFVPASAKVPLQLGPTKIAFPPHHREDMIMEFLLVLASTNFASMQGGQDSGRLGRGKQKYTDKSDDIAVLDQQIDRDLRVNGKVDNRVILNAFEKTFARSTIYAHIKMAKNRYRQKK